MNKWGRGYTLAIESSLSPSFLGVVPLPGPVITIQSPLTMDFTINRRISGSCNTGQFRILNLAPSTRSQIYKPWFSGAIRSLEVQAGYGGAFQTIFKGNVLEAVSYRPEGSVNVITDISGLDGMWAGNQVYSKLPLGAGVTQQEALKMFAADLAAGKIKTGQISQKFNAIYMKGRSFGPPLTTFEHIKNETKGNCWIDLQTLFCLTDTEYVGSDIFQITPQNILGSPKLNQQIVTCELLFEPGLIVGQPAQLTSLTNPLLNGIYRVQGFTHSGTISGAVGGKLKTTVDLWQGFTMDILGKLQELI